jgi:hypothetical protein
VAGILRLFFTEADRFDLVFLDAEQGQRTLDGFGTLLAERQVVFTAAALVGVALEQHFEALVGNQVLGVGGDQILVLVLDVVLVEVEVDAALRQLALRIGQFARQAVGINGRRRSPKRRRYPNRCAIRPVRTGVVFRQRGGGTADDQGGQQGGNKQFFHKRLRDGLLIVRAPGRFADVAGGNREALFDPAIAGDSR